MYSAKDAHELRGNPTS